jgi:hypothetical protein
MGRTVRGNWPHLDRLRVRGVQGGSGSTSGGHGEAKAMTIRRAVGGWFFTWYVVLRSLPYIARHTVGRWHVFRDAPLWLVEALATGTDRAADGRAPVDAFFAQARAELTLRRMRDG